MNTSVRAKAFLACVVLWAARPMAVQGQDVPAVNNSPAVQGTPAPGFSPGSTLDNTLTAAEAEEPARQLVKWNQFDGKYLSIRLGGGFLYEYGAYAQDDDSKKQLVMHPDDKVRDARILLRGRLKFFKRPVTYSVGLMYDGATNEWLARQTGIMVEVPEIWGYLFVGRTKEGFSLNKVMVGYAGWSMERFTMNDATIPILADGIKWFGHNEKRHFNWNLGIYKDWTSQGQSFSTYDHQAVGRFAWVPKMEEGGTLLHIGVGVRYGVPKDNKLQARSRPEANPSPYFVDTGKFGAKDTRMLGPEVYYRPGSLLVGSEYFVQKVNASDSGDPIFHGGDVFVSWLATGEVRSYNTKGGYFNGISPKRPVFEGGPGAWEFVSRFSYIDLDSGTVKGGKFWRFTPMANWHLSENVRLEMVYGIGSLNRFELQGRTQFFQTRLQLQL